MADEEFDDGSTSEMDREDLTPDDLQKLEEVIKDDRDYNEEEKNNLIRELCGKNVDSVPPASPFARGSATAADPSTSDSDGESRRRTSQTKSSADTSQSSDRKKSAKRNLFGKKTMMLRRQVK